MFRMEGRLILNKKTLAQKDCILDGDLSRTEKVKRAIAALSEEFDIMQPIWLEAGKREFKRHARTRFYQDSFLEEIPFDYFEIEMLDEDI